MSLPYYKRFPRDFLEGSIGMGLEVKGAYAIVLDLIYMRDGRLPDDARFIAGQLGCSVRKWTAIREELIARGKLQVHLGFISNFRADYLTEESRKYQDKQAEIAGRPRKNNDLPQPEPSQSEPEPEPKKEWAIALVAGGDAKVAFDEWNALASRLALPVARDLTDARRKAINARLATAGLAGWREALAAVEASPHCRGDNERSWRADMDFVTTASKFQRLLEGSYTADKATPGAAPAPAAFNGPPALRQNVVKALGEDFAAGWIDPCTWRDEGRVLVCRNAFVRDTMARELGSRLQTWNVILEVAAANSNTPPKEAAA